MNYSCSTESQLRANIERALELEGMIAEVNFKRLSQDVAKNLGLKGSPTIKINGEEIQPIPHGDFT